MESTQDSLQLSNLPKMWKYKNLVPQGYSKEHHIRTVYIIMFFYQKRALLVRRDYSLIGTIATRDARKLIKEAEENGWIIEKWEEYSGGPRPEGYKKEADVAHWIEVKNGD